MITNKKELKDEKICNVMNGLFKVVRAVESFSIPSYSNSPLLCLYGLPVVLLLPLCAFLPCSPLLTHLFNLSGSLALSSSMHACPSKEQLTLL